MQQDPRGSLTPVSTLPSTGETVAQISVLPTGRSAATVRPPAPFERNFEPRIFSARPTSGCTGRDAEIAHLLDTYHRVISNHDHQRMVLATGPGGIGKSRILQELRGRIRLEGGVVLEGRCDAGRAFGPFAEIIDRALRFLDEMGIVPSCDLEGLSCRAGCHRLWHQHSGPEPEVAVRNADLAGATPEIAAFEKRLRFFDAIYQVLRDVSTVRPPVLVLHHLERADRGTLDLLSFLLDLATEGTGSFTGGESSPLRILVVASLRNDISATNQPSIEALRSHEGSTELTVGALDAQGVRAFLSSDDTIARIIERTGGNPELIERLLEADPLTPRDRIERKLTQLSPVARELLSALVVLGRPATLETLTAIAEVHLEAGSRSAFSSDLLTRSIVDNEVLFAFERESDREECYALLGTSKRHSLHTRAIDVCVARLDLQEAVRHAIATSDFARAADLAIAAAASLAARHAHAEAAALLESLIEASGGDVSLLIREELADLYRIAGAYRAALVHARFVRAAEPENPAAARRVGYLLTVAGEFDAAREPLEAAHRLATHGVEEGRVKPAEVADVEAQLAELWYQQSNYAKASEWAGTALARAHEAGALSIEIHARNTLGKLALAQKDPAAAAELFERNRQLAAHSGLGHQEAQAQTNVGVALLLRRDLPAAEQACKRAIDVATRASDTRDRAIATENLAVIAHLARDYRRALLHYQVAVGLLKRLGNREMLGRVANNLGELYLSLGDRLRARALSDLATHVSGSDGPPLRSAQGLRLRGRIEAADGNIAQARSSFESALLVFRALSDTRAAAGVQLELAKLALMDGDVRRAREIVDSLPLEETQAAELALVRADLERSVGGDTMNATRHAVELAETANDDERLLTALVRHAHALGDTGDLGQAARLLERAQSVEKHLTTQVPDETLAAWQDRPARLELMQVQARLASTWAATRHESVPPPKALTQRPRPARTDAPNADPRFESWRQRYPDIAGSSPAIAHLLSILDKVSASDAIVLIRGESGTGKELVAEAIHNNSNRASKPIVKVNCAALVETLLLSELFGHEKGAFTGAQARKKGRFELADGGTIFLDEIGDISPKTQVALLRVLQEREFERVGGTQPIRVDVRIVAATHRDLEKMVREGTFREDLYYRLRGITIEMPALRKRQGDLPELCARLLERVAAERNESVKTMSQAALDLLSTHRWPGNVRELENVLRSATLFADSDELSPTDFEAFADNFLAPDPETSSPLRPSNIPSAENGEDARVPLDDSTHSHPIESLVYEKVRTGTTSLFDMKKALERECIVRALAETNGNITRAASLLGMKRPRLSQLVKEYELGELGK
jgi:transcriptional regulator with GAF, ATPase, and Fis domain/tetratricopeptide (TPR) repeat protein